MVVANGVDPSAEISTLRERVKVLEKKLEEKEMEVAKPKVQIADYRTREQEHKAQTSGAMREVPVTTPRAAQVSHASQTQTLTHMLTTASAVSMAANDTEAPSTTTSSRPSSQASSTEFNHLHHAAQPATQHRMATNRFWVLDQM